MKYTKNLKLPIFDNPSEDLFKVSDWNEANENIESTVTEVKDWKDSMVSADTIAEIIDARCGEKILGDKIRKIDNEINLSNENITNINSQLEEIVKITTTNITNSILTLTTSKYQKTNMVDLTEIVLPTVTDFTEIHLFFSTTEDLTLIFPSVKWQSEPSIKANKTYEIIFTYIDNWLGGVVCYE